jgi:hypothetical protein
MDGSSPNVRPESPDDGPRRQPIEYYNEAVQALDLLYEAVVSGSVGAEEILRDLAGKLAWRCESWRR